MEKPPILTDEEMSRFIEFPTEGYTTNREGLGKAQRNADLRWFVEWGSEVCMSHAHLVDAWVHQRECDSCWQELQKLAEG